MQQTTLDRIITKGRKEVPDGTLLGVALGRVPGTVSVRIRLPGQANWRTYLDLPIRDGVAELPVPLAFLSYAKEDVATVRDLESRLLQAGVLTWFDEKTLLPGDDWKVKIDDGIERSDFVLLFLSQHSVSKTGYFQRELRYALEQRDLRPHGTRYIVPVLLGECEVPPPLRAIQWLKTTEADWFERLLKALEL